MHVMGIDYNYDTICCFQLFEVHCGLLMVSYLHNCPEDEPTRRRRRSSPSFQPQRRSPKAKNEPIKSSRPPLFEFGRPTRSFFLASSFINGLFYPPFDGSSQPRQLPLSSLQPPIREENVAPLRPMRMEHRQEEVFLDAAGMTRSCCGTILSYFKFHRRAPSTQKKIGTAVQTWRGSGVLWNNMWNGTYESLSKLMSYLLYYLEDKRTRAYWFLVFTS